MATHDVNVVAAMADGVYVLLRGGEIVARGTPQDVFQDPGLLRRSNIEPPVLAELFQRLGELGAHLGRPLTVEDAARVDRKSTRLNSSHVRISYAVFCLKKKKR